MKSYNPKEWLSFIFNFHSGDTFKKLIPAMIGIGIYSGLIAHLELEYWDLSSTLQVKNITIMHNMLGFVISLLLVFRTNTAYDRWWEGRKQWGILVSNSRTLAIKLSVMLTNESDKAFFRKMIPAYATVLNFHLKEEKLNKELFDDDAINLERYKHKPNQVTKLIMYRINELYKAQHLSGEQLITLNPEIQSFTNSCGACERIKNTPIPYSYSAFIKKFIFLYVMTLPFGYVFNLGYYVIPIVVFIFYVFASLELIAEEIEDPFGNDSNDLPTHKIAENIKKNVEELLY